MSRDGDSSISRGAMPSGLSVDVAIIIGDVLAFVGLAAFIWAYGIEESFYVLPVMGPLLVFAIGSGVAGGFAATRRKPPAMSWRFVVGGGVLVELGALRTLYYHLDGVVPGTPELWVLSVIVLRVGYPLLLEEVEEADDGHQDSVDGHDDSPQR